jgi:hypothetical protein
MRLLVFLLPAILVAQSQPKINEKFPIKSGEELSPPLVSQVSGCAKAVHVSGYLPHAIVKVFANAVEQVGIDNPYFAETDVKLTRTLNVGEKITATQEALGKTSAQSPVPMVVSAYPSTLNKPVVDLPIYACGRIVPVDKLNPGGLPKHRCEIHNAHAASRPDSGAHFQHHFFAYCISNHSGAWASTQKSLRIDSQ